MNPPINESILRYMEDNRNKICLKILTPCYGGLCHSTYVMSLIDTIEFLKKYGVDVRVCHINSDSLVPRARNTLIARAMTDPKTTHMLFIDADITWHPYDVAKLLYDDKPLIGGIYPLKKYQWDKLLEKDCSVIKDWVDNKKGTILENFSDTEVISQKLLKYNVNYLSNKVSIDKNIAEVRHIPTGFMMIQRNVIDKMCIGFPYTKYVDDTGSLNQEESKNAYALFDCGVEDGHYLSEDWLFCDRWRNLQGNVFIDVTINLKHTGTETFDGCYLSSIS